MYGVVVRAIESAVAGLVVGGGKPERTWRVNDLDAGKITNGDGR